MNISDTDAVIRHFRALLLRYGKSVLHFLFIQHAAAAMHNQRIGR